MALLGDVIEFNLYRDFYLDLEENSLVQVNYNFYLKYEKNIDVNNVCHEYCQ